MAAATVQAGYFGGAATEPAGVSAESNCKFTRDDTLNSGTTPIPIPSGTGTNFSWFKNIALQVTVAGTTSISNRRVALAASLPTGLILGFKYSATYSQPTATPTASGSNGAVPTGYTAVTTANQVYDASSVATSSTGRNGGFCQLALGWDATYAGGAGATATFTINLVYDEA